HHRGEALHKTSLCNSWSSRFNERGLTKATRLDVGRNLSANFKKTDQIFRHVRSRVALARVSLTCSETLRRGFLGQSLEEGTNSLNKKRRRRMAPPNLPLVEESFQLTSFHVCEYRYPAHL